MEGQLLRARKARHPCPVESADVESGQLDYADVATRLNDRVRTDVLAQLPEDRKALEGVKVTFSGAFSALIPGTAMIVPVTLEVA